MKLFYTEICPPAAGWERAAALVPAPRRRTKPHGGSITAYALLRYVTGCEISCDEAGRPVLIGGGHASISHTAGHVLCAVSEAVCGCDIERHRPVKDAVVRRVLTPHEIAELTQEEDFFRFWCLKESFFKYRGGGSLLSPAEFALTGGPRCIDAPELRCAVFETIPGCTCAAVGERAPQPPVHIPNDLIFESLWI